MEAFVGDIGENRENALPVSCEVVGKAKLPGFRGVEGTLLGQHSRLPLEGRELMRAEVEEATDMHGARP